MQFIEQTSHGGEVISWLIAKDKGPMSLEAASVLWMSRGRGGDCVIEETDEALKRYIFLSNEYHFWTTHFAIFWEAVFTALHTM